MNKRTQQLAVNAGLYVDLAGQPWPKSMSAEECEAAYQKFTELIVQECANQVDWILAEGGKTQGDLIKEHFGIES